MAEESPGKVQEAAKGVCLCRLSFAASRQAALPVHDNVESACLLALAIIFVYLFLVLLQ